jgi:DNA repair protein RadA/Sms
VPRLSDIQHEQRGFMKLRGTPWFAEAANHQGLVRGGIYLLSGPPGGGKTTLALQLAVDLANTGHKILYLSLEQSPSDVRQMVRERIFKSRRGAQSAKEEALPAEEGLAKAKGALEAGAQEDRISCNIYLDSSVSGMESLPDFLARQVLGSAAQYREVDVIVVDSIQGLGTAPTSSKPYQRLFEFNRWAKEAGIAVILIGHITKGGAIAGPRSLEHNVDCVLYLRMAMRLRPLFVPKNRFGPARYEPLTLVTDSCGCLQKSKHVKARASRAFGFLPGLASDLIEVQALVKLPKYGDKPGIKAPYLPKQKLSQLIGIISSMREIDISDLTFEINCALPGGRPYRETLDLPLAVSMLSSYFQRQIPPESLFVGELDLFQNVRPLASGLSASLCDVLTPGEGCPMADCMSNLYIADSNADEVKHLLAKKGLNVRVHRLETLEGAVRAMWPDAV